MSDKTVLVTGASGFIAKHIILALLDAGYTVRGTVRNSAKAETVRAALANAGKDPESITFYEADLTSDESWPDAVAGCAYVVHTASPFPVQQPDEANELIEPARDGTLRVLEHARSAGVQRVILTSSTVAMLYGPKLPAEHIYTEADFTDETRADLTPYIRSKTIAEKAAWDFVKSKPDAPELVVINPGFVQGPALDADLSTSHEVFRLMAEGKYPAAPKIRFPVAHVTDVARAHVRALEIPEAAGNRYLVANGMMSLFELAARLKEHCPDLASKAPKFELPDMAVRALAVGDKRLRTILPELGQIKQYSNAKITAELKMALSSAETAVDDSVRSLRQLGLI